MNNPTDDAAPSHETQAAGPNEVPMAPYVSTAPLAGAPVKPPPPPVGAQAPNRRRWTILTALAAAALAALVGLVVWAPWVEHTPRTPTSLRADSPDTTSVLLRWDPRTGGPSADQFVILQGDDDVATAAGSDTSCLVEELTPNTTYRFAVAAVAGDRRSDPSPELVVTTDPGTPRSVQAGKTSATTVSVGWTAPRGPSADQFVILQGGDEVGTAAGSDTSFLVKKLTPGATYRFAVVAVVGDRRSEPAAVTETTIAPSPGGLSYDPAKTTTDTIAFTWAPPTNSPPPVKYVIFRGGKRIGSVAGDETSYTDAGLAPATAYKYQVAASWGHDRSEPSSGPVMTTVEPPVADARLTGEWPVEVTLLEDPGGNLEIGSTWTANWDFDPVCEAGVCDVTVTGDFSPPGFTFREFTATLIRDGGEYVGSGQDHITDCGSVALDNTVTVRVAVETAHTVDGTWLASSWSGTLDVASPYVEDGGFYCGTQNIRAGLAAAIHGR